MRHYERVETGLNGQKADRIPIVPIYDYGYVMTSIGRDMRSYMTASAKERIEFIEESFLRHKMIDGLFVHAGCNDNWVNNNEVEKFENYWMITNKISGEKYRLLPDGCKADKEGNPFLRNLSNKGISRITSKYDIDRLLPAVPTEEAVEGSGQFWPLRHISQKYPGYHLSFQISTPMVRAINICGGFEEGLTTMAEDRNLFREIIERYTPLEEALIEPGKKAGGNSIWLTSYYTGADTISPKDYAELVFPYEKRICEKAKANGLKVLYWFLGDLMPVLKKVMEMPIDALVLEQGRKGYDIDPVEIRKYVGNSFCLFGFGYETDFCNYNKLGLKQELMRQVEGAGRQGAFIAGTPIMPPDANPEAVDYYFEEVVKIGSSEQFI